MIRIARTPCPAVLDPDDAGSKGARELREITAKVNAEENPVSKDFTAYKDVSVRNALRVMFHRKCAYCETPIAGSQDTDIEHYRPKGKVSEAGPDHPGYWWLAMDWDNLVLSCMHCNQIRKGHTMIPGGIETREELETFLKTAPLTRAGKLDAFPTADNFWVTTPQGDLAQEQPLILNPVDVDPADHLDWVFNGVATTMRGRNRSPAGDESCRILGLNRRWLEEDRRLVLLRMMDLRNKLIAAMNDWLEADLDAVAEVHALRAEEHFDSLMAYTDVGQPFAGMALAYVTQVQAEVSAMQDAVG